MNARSSLAIVAALLFCAVPASALTLLQLSGTGDLTIETSGSIFLDTGANVFESITLVASTITAPGTPGAPDTTLALTGLDGYEMSFGDDLTLEILSWTGTLSLFADDTIVLVGPLLTPTPGGGAPCDLGAVIVSSGPAPPVACDEVVIVRPGDGSIGVVPPIVVAIPEPAAALVFALGLAIVRARARRR